MMFRSASILIALMLVLGQVAAAEPTVQDSLAGALQCKDDPLATVRSIAGSKRSTFDRGIAVFTYGEEMDMKNVLILRSPIVVAGAHTSAVVLDFATSYDNFNAWVFGVFDGDYERVVKHLGLKAVSPDKNIVVGKYQRSLDIDLDGKPDTYCPKTIGLTPLKKKGKFLLGCGWCNG